MRALSVILIGLSVSLAVAIPVQAAPALVGAVGLGGELPEGGGAAVGGLGTQASAAGPAAGGRSAPDFFGLGTVPIPIEPSAPREPVRSLPGLPSAFLLTLFGCLCVGLVQGRRRWTAFLVGLCSLCAAGLGSLPRLMASVTARQSIHRPAAGAFHPAADRLPVTGTTADIEFVGLLRRLGSEADSSGTDLRYVASLPAVGAWASRAAAGSFVLGLVEVDSGALFPNGAAVQRDAEGVMLPRRRIPSPSCHIIPLALLARPPPAVS